MPFAPPSARRRRSGLWLVVLTAFVVALLAVVIAALSSTVPVDAESVDAATDDLDVGAYEKVDPVPASP